MFQGKECMIKTDSYTYVKGIYDRYCPERKQHHLVQCKLYSCISEIFVLLEGPLIDMWVHKDFLER